MAAASGGCKEAPGQRGASSESSGNTGCPSCPEPPAPGQWASVCVLICPRAQGPISDICCRAIFQTHCPRGWGCKRQQNRSAYILIWGGEMQYKGGGRCSGCRAGEGRPGRLWCCCQGAVRAGLLGSWRKRGRRPGSTWGEGVLSRKSCQCKPLGQACVAVQMGRADSGRSGAEGAREPGGSDVQAFGRTLTFPAGLGTEESHDLTSGFFCLCFF